MVTHPPPSRATRWLESGWLDVEFYAALRGRGFRDAAEAARDFVDHGMQERLSPHPGLHFVNLPAHTRRAWRHGRVGQVLADLRGNSTQVGSPTLTDPSARADLLALARGLAREGAGEEPSAPSVDWAAVARTPRRPDLTSVVVVAAEARPTARTVQSVLDTAADRALQVLVVDCGSPPHVALGLHAALHARPEVELLRLPSSVTPAAAAEAGVARAEGEVVLLLEPHVLLRRGALDPLLAVLDDPEVAGAQPVLLGPDDTIVCAGLVVPAVGEAPEPLLAGLPADDARRLEGRPLAAISAEAMALRVEDVAVLGGMDAGLPRASAALDLCARIRKLRTGGFRVASAARASSHVGAASPASREALPPHLLLPPDPGLYQRIGFVTSAGDRAPDGSPGAPVVTGRRPAHPGQLRWSIKLPSVPGPAGDLWGDTHFGEALAEALRDLGEDVVACRRTALAGELTHLDDVSLALRGLYPVPPTPGQVNVLWVISHPDEVDPAELEGYDHVFAASDSWSAVLAARAGRRVVPLLQASRFEAPRAASPREAGVVFVGNAGDGRRRPLIRMALDAGVPLVVYGRGWHGLPDGVWRGAYVDNRSLPELYSRYGIVLADHWPDMARHGFVANRVFDAVASGARVICDDVRGVHDVFDPRDVLVVHDAAQLGRAYAELRRTSREPDVPRPSLSFHHRARTLLAEVSRR